MKERALLIVFYAILAMGVTIGIGFGIAIVASVL